MRHGLLAFALLLVCACRESPTIEPTPRLVLDPCPPEEAIEDGLCGTLDVFEDREASEGRTISLRIVVLPALSGNAAPDPVFLLAGGPGQAATEMTGLVRRALRGIHRDRDLVFVDQRGTGSSNALECELSDEREDDALLLDPMADEILMAETQKRLRQCLEEIDGDPRFYTTPIAMDDLDDVRDALGYSAINLWGGSYGTRAALVYLRRHGDRVRTAILDGLAPAAIKLPLHMGMDARRALSLLIEDCAADAACESAYPELEARLGELLDRLEGAPVRQTIDHPRTGVPTRVVVTRTAVASMIRGALYSPELASLIPLAIYEAHAGDYRALAAMGLGVSGGVELSMGMFLSVVCAEDVPAITAAERAEARKDPFHGTRLLEVFGSLCEVWPKGLLPEGYHEPVHSDRPVLLLSGLLDPVTPPRWGDEVSQYLTNSLHVVVPGVGHNTLATGCVPDLMQEFVSSGTLEDLDVSCVERIRRPRFFDSPLGPGTRRPS